MKHATALKGFIGAEWAVEESWARQAAQVIILGGDKSAIPEREEAVSQYGEIMGNCRYTVLAGNKAIVDVYGAIMPRATLMSEWSGGTACQALQKDIAFLMNTNVDEVIFAIHSPGGEVTGVSETAQQIKELSKYKKTTAYIAGYGCSAAYWLASACNRIIANETATVGSIGVMSVYVDKTKQLEMIGLEEIEFISSQSPLKNIDPKTDKGKESIQRRVNAQAQRFVESVAENRNVSVEKVLTDFGQGDVFAGNDLKLAVAAGMIDGIGSMADTINNFGEMPNIKGANMADKQETAFNAEEKAEFEAMKSEFAQLKADREKDKAALELLQTEKARLEKEKQTSELTAIAGKFEGETAKHLVVLEALAANGQDSPAFKAYVEQQTALSKQIETGSLFLEEGSNHSGGSEKSPLAELNEKAEAIAKAKGITTAAAFTEAVEANPELYARYNAERQAARGDN